MNTEATFYFDCGCLLRRLARRILEAQRFSDPDLRWIEQKSFLSSHFIVRGSQQSLLAIYRFIKQMETD